MSSDDTGSPVIADYGPTSNRFNGQIELVQLDVGEDNHAHLITAEQWFNSSRWRQ